ncbi:MAG: hypothetical protein JW717_10965 [Marinilabiliaceae bacterium]|nr:hypothetical protein [Marinilabiliaceae bacterium]
MKSFRIKVQEDKVQFFYELLTYLGFVEFEQVEDYHEPRIYPGGNFEIRSGVSSPDDKLKSKVSQKNDEGLDSIRKVLNQIEKQRNKNRK